MEVPVRHHARKHGQTNYGLGRTVNVILDLFTEKFLISYAHKPIYLYGGAGLLLIVPSFLALLSLAVQRFTLQVSVLGSSLFQTSTMSMILGIQSILMGLIAKLLVRTYQGSRAKPTYTVRRFLSQPQKQIRMKRDNQGLSSDCRLVVAATEHWQAGGVWTRVLNIRLSTVV